MPYWVHNYILYEYFPVRCIFKCNTPAGPKNPPPPSADTEESDDTSGSYNTLQHGCTVLAQLERSVKSDEAHVIIDSVREALGK